MAGRRIGISFIAIIFVVFLAAAAQAGTGAVLWDAGVPSAGAIDVAVEGNRVYVVGNVVGAGGTDWHVRALDAGSGASLWEDRFDAAGRSDSAQAVAVRGAIVVAGGVVTNAAGNRDAFVRVYDTITGAIRWQDEFDRAGRSDEFSFHTISIGRDAVYLGGIARKANGDADWFVRAYELTSGARLWQDIFDGGSFDHPVSLAAAGGRVFAGGVITDSSITRHFTVRAYDAKSGSLLWQDQVPTGSVGFFFAADVAWELAAEGNRLVAAGTIADDTGIHWAVRAYDTASGSLHWSHLEDFGAGADIAVSVALDGSHVFASGAGGPNCSAFVASNCDIIVRAYDHETGSLLWNASLDGAGGDDEGNVVRAAGNQAIVASTVTSSMGAVDWLVHSYDVRTGAPVWMDRLEAPGGFAFPNQIAVSGSRAFVIGVQFDASGEQDAVVRAYDLH